MKTRKNPFEIFGITPQMVKELEDELLFKIVKSNYRILQLKYHPDKGGSLTKTRELNLAFDLINLEKNPESYFFYKKKYLERLSRKTMKNKIEALEKTLKKLVIYDELLRENFWYFLREYKEIYSELNQGKGLYIKVFDVVAHNNFSHLKIVKKHLFFKELFFTPYEVIRKKYHAIDTLKNYTYLGTIKRGLIEPWVLLERSFEEELYLKPSIKEEIFVKECLVFLRPEPRQNAYVFFYNPSEKKVYLEGVIINHAFLEREKFLESFLSYST